MATLINNNLGRKQHAEVTLNGECVTVMTNVIWMLSWLLQGITAMTVLPKPNNLTLTSKKFIHLLTWKPGPDTPPNTYYNVSVLPWLRGTWVLVCERVRSPLLCNLTEHFPHHKEVYYTKIRAGLGSNVSEPVFYHRGFVPLNETEMEQPLLTVAPCGPGSLCVDLQPPEERLRNVYQDLHYHLKVQTSRPQLATFTQTTKGLEGHILKDLVPGRQYCVFVSFFDKYLPRDSNYSQPVCAFTTDLPPGWAKEIVALLCVLMVWILVGLVLLWWTGFICLKVVLPSNLMDVTNNPKEEQFHPMEGQFVLDGIISLVLVESVSSTGGKGNSHRQSEEGCDDDDDDDEGEAELESPSGSGGDVYASRSLALSPSPCSSSSSSSSTPTVQSSSIAPVSSDQHSVLRLERSNGIRDHAHSPQLRPASPLRSQPTDIQSAVGADRHAPAERSVLSTVPLGSGQGVNLWSLTFGGRGPEEVNRDAAPPPSDGGEKAPDNASTPLLLPSQEATDTVEEVTVENVAASEEEEEEEEECSGYLKR